MLARSLRSCDALACRWQQLLNPRRGPLQHHHLMATPDGAGGWLAGSGGSGVVAVNSGGGSPSASLPSFLGVYTLVCLMPATLASMGLVLFYYRKQQAVCLMCVSVIMVAEDGIFRAAGRVPAGAEHHHLHGLCANSGIAFFPPQATWAATRV